ncbi:NAD(P)/FAD-dependent oxidoreductase [Paenibacillus psychroresistens]|uniref:Ferredoxin--NADP reductase n=1 Tax=Paenibacillus psychroresistens TaxID=1778678 RepID=A0A6B8RJZ1_9BACL|nr:NAD(P)/FAD-dependent oxidoreductase [Paenibacillus psychroresistens]QGQ95912.1 NAD(P)/FAD-dependent oxidoreductase [Paenibacillus psychroresistens]
MQENELFDVTIIGGGPAGMYAAFYGGMRNMKIKLIEGTGELGGFLHTYSEKTIWDVGGIPPIRCDKLIGWLAQQARTFEPTLVFNQNVIELQNQTDGSFVLKTNTGESHYTRTIILATGRGIVELQKLEIEGANRYELTNLYYTVQDLNSFRGKHILISGGGDSAVDWAIELAEVARKITVVHRKRDFRAMERNVETLKEIADIRTPYEIVRLHGDNDTIHSATIAHVERQDSVVLDIDAVIVSHGFRSNYGTLHDLGFVIDDGVLAVNDQTETDVPGIYAAGDCTTYKSKVRLIAGAFNDAILAINSAKRYLDPEAPGMAYVSSHNDIFTEMNKHVSTSLKDLKV